MLCGSNIKLNFSFGYGLVWLGKTGLTRSINNSSRPVWVVRNYQYLNADHKHKNV
jgi:hypothetical protein